MQSLPIYLYPNTLDVILDLDPNVLGVNRVMYQRDLKIQNGDVFLTEKDTKYKNDSDIKTSEILKKYIDYPYLRKKK